MKRVRRLSLLTAFGGPGEIVESRGLAPLDEPWREPYVNEVHR